MSKAKGPASPYSGGNPYQIPGDPYKIHEASVNVRPSVHAIVKNFANSATGWLDKVREFQLKRMRHDLPIPLMPTVANEYTRASCVGLLYEESRELQKALVVGDLEDIADGVADLIYITIGVAILHGVDLGPIFAEVHIANMEKKPAAGGFGRSTVDGRSTKEGWSPPRIAEILAVQREGG